ncbi:MAG: MarR family transcriptional regulator [Streptosporangiaceae bacterium]|jgi:MarR family transcriptional regulator for hemolysin|nr:MarR family transcriptional regulator [Streptosporangiaceae bacterium]
MGPPHEQPIGLLIARAAKELNRAFERALAEQGGSQPMWLILLSLKRRPDSTQRLLAEDVGIREATLTHHLNGMERAGLVTRRRDPANRRVHQVGLTEEGEAAFHRMRTAAMAFDRRLRSGVPDDRLADLRTVLQELTGNVGEP